MLPVFISQSIRTIYKGNATLVGIFFSHRLLLLTHPNLQTAFAIYVISFIFRIHTYIYHIRYTAYGCHVLKKA